MQDSLDDWKKSRDFHWTLSGGMLQCTEVAKSVWSSQGPLGEESWPEANTKKRRAGRLKEDTCSEHLDPAVPAPIPCMFELCEPIKSLSDLHQFEFVSSGCTSSRSV